MTRSSSWPAPVLTLLTLAATLGVVLDSKHRTAFVVGTWVLIIGSLALFVGQRILRRSPDWRLIAPYLVGVTALAAMTSYGLEAAVGFALLAVVTYFFGARERRVAAAAEATSGTALHIMAALLAFFAALGGPRLAPAWLIAAAIWAIVWMPASNRRIYDEDALHVARSPEQVSAYLLDQRLLPLWYPSYVSSELVNGQEPGVGATFRQVVEFRRRQVEALVMVDEYEPGRRLCTHVMQVPGRGHSCYSFSPDGGGTTAAYTYEGEQPYPGALIGSTLFVGRALRRVRERRAEAFDKLKSILEA
ncbi:MAG TPA: SRPBCC family protein [Candidatus Dormibacteraeota bacterium]|nr:SRPBCC family protein [Candidatus Dormibacteraeota bacterium]